MWEKRIEGEPPVWGLGNLSASSTYVVAVGTLVTLSVLALVLAQRRYLGQAIDLGDMIGKFVLAALGGIGAGFLAPYIAYGVLDASVDVGRFLGWTFSGAFAGAIVSRAVINMELQSGLLGGAVGGLLGCTVLYTTGQNLFMGLAATGGLIGCMLAYCETSSRAHWLVIDLKLDGAPNRQIEVSLGKDPVRIGYAKGSDIRVDAIPGAPLPDYATFEIQEGRVVFIDLLRQTRASMAADQTVQIANAAITIKSK
jgi:hypothetical protein